jgi:O-antigen/teichoic acid export membrane protein
MARVTRSKPVRDFVSLLKSGMLAQLLIFLSIPIILAAYDPASFGEFTIVISVATLIGVISSLRIERAIVVEPEAALSYLVRLCVALTVVSSVICFVAVYLLAAVAVFPISDEIPMSLLAATYCLATGLHQILSHIAIRQGRSPIIGLSDLMFAVSLLGLLYFVPAEGNGAMILLLVYAVAKCAALVTYVSIGWTGYFVGASESQRLRPALGKYVYPVWTTILSNLQFRGIYYLSGAAYGTLATGNISLAHRVMYAPVNLIGTALRRAYFKEFRPGNERSEQINRHASRILEVGSFGALLQFPLLQLLIAEFGGLIPEKWNQLPSYLLTLYPAAAILMVLSWLDRVYDARGMQRKALVYELAYTIVLYACLLSVLGFFSAIAFLKTYTVITVAYNIFWAWRTLDLLGVRQKTLVILGMSHASCLAIMLFTV